MKDAVSLAKSSLWLPGGTGARIFGEQTANKAVSTRAQDQKKAQERLANMQQKLQNKNLSIGSVFREHENDRYPVPKVR